MSCRTGREEISYTHKKIKKYTEKNEKEGRGYFPRQKPCRRGMKERRPKVELLGRPEYKYTEQNPKEKNCINKDIKKRRLLEGIEAYVKGKLEPLVKDIKEKGL